MTVVVVFAEPVKLLLNFLRNCFYVILAFGVLLGDVYA
jgi:hypothetical protein